MVLRLRWCYCAVWKWRKLPISRPQNAKTYYETKSNGVKKANELKLRDYLLMVAVLPICNRLFYVCFSLLRLLITNFCVHTMKMHDATKDKGKQKKKSASNCQETKRLAVSVEYACLRWIKIVFKLPLFYSFRYYVRLFSLADFFSSDKIYSVWKMNNGFCWSPAVFILLKVLFIEQKRKPMYVFHLKTACL